MFTAVYYPHTAVRDENFLKHALLYWDEVEYISPFDSYNVLPRYPQTNMQELAKFTKPRVPTSEEKGRAHHQIMELLAGKIPSWLQVDRTQSRIRAIHITHFSNTFNFLVESMKREKQ